MRYRSAGLKQTTILVLAKSFRGDSHKRFYDQYSSRRLKSRRRRFFKLFFSTLLPTRLVCSLIWVSILPFIEHTKDQKIFSIACLLDIALLGRYLLIGATTPNEYIDVEETTEVLTKDVRSVAQATGCISVSKAIIVIEARERQYGPKALSNSTPPASNTSRSVPDVSAQPQMVVYARREKVGSGQRKGYNAPKPGLDEAELFPGFLRCTCCIDCSVTSSLDIPEYDIEAAPLSAKNRDRSEKRLSFLQKSPVAAVFGFIPEDGSVKGVHTLCNICERACAEIINHLAAMKRRSKLERSLHPKRDICSLLHCDSPSTLQHSSLTCHLAPSYGPVLMTPSSMYFLVSMKNSWHHTEMPVRLAPRVYTRRSGPSGWSSSKIYSYLISAASKDPDGGKEAFQDSIQ
jgi:hypothetical protein